TPAEHAAWREKAAAAGVSPSALLREAMARTHTWTAAARSVERERTRQIARIGNNLNQLVRWASIRIQGCICCDYWTYEIGGVGSRQSVPAERDQARTLRFASACLSCPSSALW
ncbi:MAG: MobC family plasmid mobilization relaxosome protein, partial [Gemmatimonadales bacterium]|nr:MobC family plasmid mobilization relaxosome protein [Candidatus Palauibacter denitrificans]